MSRTCSTCRGSGRIGEGYKCSVKYRGQELEELDHILTIAIGKSHSEGQIERIKELRDRLYKPEPSKKDE